MPCIIEMKDPMPEVDVGRCGGVDPALRKLKRLIESNRIVQDQRSEHHIPPSEKRAVAKKAASKRAAKRREKEDLYKRSCQLSHKITLARQNKSIARDVNIVSPKAVKANNTTETATEA